VWLVRDGRFSNDGRFYFLGADLWFSAGAQARDVGAVAPEDEGGEHVEKMISDHEKPAISAMIGAIAAAH
jgi:hypothetical protein